MRIELLEMPVILVRMEVPIYAYVSIRQHTSAYVSMPVILVRMEVPEIRSHHIVGAAKDQIAVTVGQKCSCRGQQSRLLLQLRQYLYFSTCKASKLSTGFLQCAMPAQ
jgi:hypothetical protein